MRLQLFNEELHVRANFASKKYHMQMTRRVW